MTGATHRATEIRIHHIHADYTNKIRLVASGSRAHAFLRERQP